MIIILVFLKNNKHLITTNYNYIANKLCSQPKICLEI